MKAILDCIKLRPKTSIIEITFRCNLRCLHCASDVNADITRGQELTLEEIKQVVNDLKYLESEHVILSGGEALLRLDWQQIAQYIVSQGMRVSLISNGLAINSRIARQIKDAGVGLVALSIDGIESTHNYIRNNPASFIRVKEAAALLSEQKIRVNFVTTVTRTNLDQLNDIEEIVLSLNANSWMIQLGSPLGRLNRHPELVIRPDDLPALAETIIAAKQRHPLLVCVGDNIGYYSDHEEKLRATAERKGFNYFCGCSAGCLVVGIESNGNVKGCLSLQSERFIEGNIRQESLVDIWQKKGNFAYTRDFKIEDLKGNCQECEYGELCRGGCTFMAFGATGLPHSNPYCLHTVMKKNGINNMAKSV